MKSWLKITHRLLDEIRIDLRRPHRFAVERVGFVLCRFAHTPTRTLLILSCDYHPVADDDYIDDNHYGAVINSAAFRNAMQLAYSRSVGLFHVHLHEHTGRPVPSNTDMRETSAFVPDFFHVRPHLPHGALILSSDSLSGRVWRPDKQIPRAIDRFSIIGFPLSQITD
jgi:hypothetical protein